MATRALRQSGGKSGSERSIRRMVKTSGAAACPPPRPLISDQRLGRPTLPSPTWLCELLKVDPVEWKRREGEWKCLKQTRERGDHFGFWHQSTWGGDLVFLEEDLEVVGGLTSAQSEGQRPFASCIRAEHLISHLSASPCLWRENRRRSQSEPSQL